MFIELTLARSKEKILINKTHIVDIKPKNNIRWVETTIHNFGEYLEVTESYEEIKKLLGDSE